MSSLQRGNVLEIVSAVQTLIQIQKLTIMCGECYRKTRPRSVIPCSTLEFETWLELKIPLRPVLPNILHPQNGLSSKGNNTHTTCNPTPMLNQQCNVHHFPNIQPSVVQMANQGRNPAPNAESQATHVPAQSQPAAAIVKSCPCPCSAPVSTALSSTCCIIYPYPLTDIIVL